MNKTFFNISHFRQKTTTEIEFAQAQIGENLGGLVKKSPNGGVLWNPTVVFKKSTEILFQAPGKDKKYMPLKIYQNLFQDPRKDMKYMQLNFIN